MNENVPILSIVFMVISCLIAFLVPVGLLLYFRIKKKADILPFFVGCAVMLIFASNGGSAVINPGILMIDAPLLGLDEAGDMEYLTDAGIREGIYQYLINQ